MANSNTEHSKALRNKTSIAHRKERIASGKAKQISLLLPTELANRFDDYCKSHGLNRTQAIAQLLDTATE